MAPTVYWSRTLIMKTEVALCREGPTVYWSRILVMKSEVALCRDGRH